MNVKPFFDTNILIYSFGEGDPRNEVSRILLATGGVIGVQTLNEFVSVARSKLKFSWQEVSEALRAVRDLCPTIIPLTLDTHEAALPIAERYGYHIFDSLVIAAALEARCRTLYSEDMQDGQKIGDLTIRNPFAPKP
jgi:predicted nucleic acid-binding protein